MKYKTKKTLIVSGVVLGAASVVAAVTSIYFTSPSIKRISTEGIYINRQNTKLLVPGYRYDTSATYGNASSNTVTVLLTNDLIHLKTEGKLQLEQNQVKKPSFQSYEFGLADSIVVRLKNIDNPNEEMELVFDNDDAEKADVPASFKSVVFEKDSENKRSINNKKIFQKLLSIGAMNKKVQLDDMQESDIDANGKWVINGVGFTIRPNVKWVDSNGNETKYNVVAEDFWYSFMRTKLFDKNYRRENGGSKELDSYFITKANATQRFQEKDKYPNEYLYGFFDLDSSKLYKKETAIQKTFKDGRDMFMFSSFDNVNRTTGFSSVVSKFLANNLQLSAAPSEYIKELANNESLNKINSNLEISGLARQFGIYTYGQTRTQTLYASPYIPKSAFEQREIFEYNKHYSNKKWVNAVEKGELNVNGKKVKALKKIIFEYAGGIDTSTYNTQLLQSYLQGTVSEIKYSDLTTAQRSSIFGSDSSPEEIAKTATQNGLQYTKTLNISSLVQRTLIQSNPSHLAKEYGFNDNYSKLVFGLSHEELKKGTNNTTNSFFINDGFEFRLLIQAAVNWDAYVGQTYSNQRILWLNGTAQDAKFTTVNDGSKAPIDYYEEVNTLDFIDWTSSAHEAQIASVTPEEMREHSKQNIDSNDEQMKSPKFKLIQANMKRILNKYYKENNLNPSEKIKWEVVYPWADQNVVKVTILENVVKVIKSLDSRLEPTVFVPKNSDELIAKINKNTGVSDFHGWGYDYEGIGSYIAAFSSSAHGVSILNSIPIFAKNINGSSSTLTEQEQRIKFLQEKYPQFTKLSRYLKEKTDEEMRVAGLMEDKYKELWVENWDKLSNSINQDPSAYFRKITNNKYDPGVNLAKLLRSYEGDSNLTNEEWAALIREFNSIKGVSLDADNSILNPYSADLTLFLREYIIPISKYGIQYFQDYRYIEEEN